MVKIDTTSLIGRNVLYMGFQPVLTRVRPGTGFAGTCARRFVVLEWSECPAVERAPGKVGGEWLFKGTRVPVKALFENLEDGARVDEFLEWFPGVTRKQVEQVLQHAERSLAPA
jgi:uncharacterized protein (DUF433 family)